MSKPLSILLGLLFIISGSSGCLKSSDNSSNTESEIITSLKDVYLHVLQCENIVIENGTGSDFDTNFRTFRMSFWELLKCSLGGIMISIILSKTCKIGEKIFLNM